MATATRKMALTRIPVLPLRGMMVFPHMVLHFDVGRAKSIAALEKAMMDDQKIFLVAQKDTEVEDPAEKDLYKVGTIAQVKQVLNLPGDNIRVLVEGERRATLEAVIQEDPFMLADVHPVKSASSRLTDEMKALVRTTHGECGEGAEALCV